MPLVDPLDARPAQAPHAPTDPTPATRVESSNRPTVSNLGALWASVARQASGSNALLRTALINSELAELAPAGATIDCPPRFASVASKGVSAVATALSELVGRRIEVTVRVREASTEPPGSGDAPAPIDRGEPAAAPSSAPASTPPAGPQPSEDGRSEPPVQRARPFNANLALENELVKRALELFNARVVDVQPRKR